jgi:hypothetical protein
MAHRIPKGTTLDVTLEWIRRAKGVNPTSVEELEKIAADYKGRDRVFDTHTETKRIERQRTLWAMMPDSTAKDRLKEAMLERAWILLDSGQCDACDALLEFLPSKDAHKMLDEYFPEEAA